MSIFLVGLPNDKLRKDRQVAGVGGRAINIAVQVSRERDGAVIVYLHRLNRVRGRAIGVELKIGNIREAERNIAAKALDEAAKINLLYIFDCEAEL